MPGSDLEPSVAEALDGIEVGQEIVVVTWLQPGRARRAQGPPEGDESLPLTGVFATRSPDRPNPLGLHA